MNQRDVDILFEYLKKILFDKKVPIIDASEVSLEYAKLVQGMNMLNKWIGEGKEFSEHIALGNLNCPGPSRENPICDPLKMLRSNLSHLVWQARQVAQGDYKQKVVMLGEFSDGFNLMIEQLKQREEELIERNNHIMDKASALHESNDLLSCITENMKDFIIVLDDETKEVVFENKSSVDFTEEDSATQLYIKMLLQKYKAQGTRRFWEIEILPAKDEEESQYYEVHSFHIDWQGRKSTAHLLTDITAHRHRESTIESIANTDDLTGLYNRRYCMEVLEELVRDNEAFSVCYADLDGLKYVNDHFGHSYGDNYLQAVSHVFREVFRSSDTICRIGGDEFVIILKNCPYQFMDMRMRQVYEKIDNMSENNEWGIPMSVSYGIYSCANDNDLSPDELLERADMRMYAFKQANNKMRV